MIKKKKIQQKLSAKITSMATKMIPNTGKIKSKKVSAQLSSYSLDIKVPTYAHYSKRLVQENNTQANPYFF